MDLPFSQREATLQASLQSHTGFRSIPQLNLLLSHLLEWKDVRRKFSSEQKVESRHPSHVVAVLTPCPHSQAESLDFHSRFR